MQLRSPLLPFRPTLGVPSGQSESRIQDHQYFWKESRDTFVWPLSIFFIYLLPFIFNQIYSASFGCGLLNVSEHFLYKTHVNGSFCVLHDKFFKVNLYVVKICVNKTLLGIGKRIITDI